MKIITKKSIMEFRSYLISEEKSASTLEKYIRDICSFAEWANEKALTKEMVLEYKQLLISKYAPASVNSMLSSINSFFSYKEWYDLRVKALKIQKQLFSDKEKELTKEEYTKLLKAAEKTSNIQLNLLMQTICCTGIRVSELQSITVEAVKNRQAIVNNKGKMRIIIIPDVLCKMLMKYIKEKNIKSGAIFITKTGKPLNRSNIWRLMKKLCETAGVSRDKVFPHNLRHLFARTHYSMQKDIVRLADVLGHSSINTTRIYTMETGEIHRQQIQKLGLLRC